MPDNNDFAPPDDPWTLFGEWYALAEKHEKDYPNAFSLATVGGDGMPSVRILLLKGHETGLGGGLTFFTNKQSHKGQQLAEHPRSAMCFYWKSLKRQIRIEGPVTDVEEAEADAYFATRARGSQIGAWASLQSEPLGSRAELVARVAEIERRYENQTVPRPPHWGGYRLLPLQFEFWQEREFRLHDRILYHRRHEKDSWRLERLYP